MENHFKKFQLVINPFAVGMDKLNASLKFMAFETREKKVRSVAEQVDPRLDHDCLCLGHKVGSD